MIARPSYRDIVEAVRRQAAEGDTAKVASAAPDVPPAVVVKTAAAQELVKIAASLREVAKDESVEIEDVRRVKEMFDAAQR